MSSELPIQIILLGLSNLNNNPHIKKEAEKDLDVITIGYYCGYVK